MIALILGGAECLWNDLHAFLVACHAPAGLVHHGWEEPERVLHETLEAVR